MYKIHILHIYIYIYIYTNIYIYTIYMHICNIYMYIYKLGKTCFQHDMAYKYFKYFFKMDINVDLNQ